MRDGTNGLNCTYVHKGVCRASHPLGSSGVVKVLKGQRSLFATPSGVTIVWQRFLSRTTMGKCQ